MASRAKAKWDHGGKSSTERGYGREYRRLRAMLFAQEPLCRPCKAKGRTTAATMCDHIVPLAKSGAAHSIENLQPICRSCHQDKSNRDKGHRVKPRIQPDGWPKE